MKFEHAKKKKLSHPFNINILGKLEAFIKKKVFLL